LLRGKKKEREREREKARQLGERPFSGDKEPSSPLSGKTGREQEK